MTMPGASHGEVALPSTHLHHITAQAIPDQTYEIRMWVPPSYTESPARSYPALYLLDGDHCFGMAVDTVRYLIRGGNIPELLIAAVGYGSDRPREEGGGDMRSHDFAFPDMGVPGKARGELFHRVLGEEIVPFLESTYRMESDHRTLYGFSLGALFGLCEMLLGSTTFSRYILVSPPLNPQTERVFALAETFVTSRASTPVTAYLCGGELDPVLPWFPRLTAILEKAAAPAFHFEWELLARGVHMTVPGEALAKGLTALLGMKSIYAAMYEAYVEGGIESAMRVYHDTKARSGTEYSFAEGELNAMGYMLLYQGHVLDAIEVFQLNVLAYPGAWNTYDSLAEAHMVAGNTALAIENYQQSVELNPKNDTGIAQLQKLRVTVAP